MSEIRIEQVAGHQAGTAIDEFYKKNGSKGTARKDDHFFVAYSENKIVGCVRFCIEDKIALLRTMYIDSSCRQQGIGRMLLKDFANYLDQNKIQNVFCLPFPHLENFYGIINFERILEKEVPSFLVDRAETYRKSGTNTIYMRRL